MLSATGSALVAGGAIHMARHTETIRVLRGFVRGAAVAPAKPGDIIDVSVADASTLISARKAERYTRPAVEAVSQKPEAPAAAKAPGKGA